MTTALFRTPNLQSLSLDELKALKAQWYQEADNHGILRGLAEVARTLGKKLPERYGPKFRWEGGDEVEIYVDDYGHYMTVHHKGRLVCSTHSDRLFVPGDWSTQPLSLLTQARDCRDAERAAIEDKERARLVEELGGF